MCTQDVTLAEASNVNIASAGVNSIGSSTKGVKRVIVSATSPYSTITASVTHITSDGGVGYVELLPTFTEVALPTGYGTYYVAELEVEVTSEVVNLNVYNTGGSDISYSASMRTLKRSVR